MVCDLVQKRAHIHTNLHIPFGQQYSFGLRTHTCTHTFHGISFIQKQLSHMMKSMKVELIKDFVLNLNEIQRI